MVPKLIISVPKWINELTSELTNELTNEKSF